MLFWIFLGTLAAGVATGIFALNSMRPVDKVTLVLKMMQKSGFMTFLVKTGLINRMRSKVTEITAPNGFKLKVPSKMFICTLEPVLGFKTRPDDVILATYPKAGTTWGQEITWLICNNADTAAAKCEPVTSRSPFLETVDFDESHRGLQSLENWPMDKQRIIKTHLPYELLPEEVTKGNRKVKIIVVARNPKDVCVSYFHFHRMVFGLPEPGTWDEFFTNFCKGEVASGCWFQHTLKYWEEYQKNKEQIHFVTYEDLKKDLHSEITSLAKFLGKELTEEQINVISEHCTFGSMSKNKQTNYSSAEKVGMDFKKSKFMRKGQVGDWKNYFTLNQSAAFDEMYDEKMKGTGLTIPFET